MLLHRTHSMSVPDKTKLPNLVTLGIIDQEGTTDIVPRIAAALKKLKAQGATAAYLPGLPLNKAGYLYVGQQVDSAQWKEKRLVIPSGFALYGDDPSGSTIGTVLLSDPRAYEKATRPMDWLTFGCVALEDRAQLWNFHFNGRRELILGGAETTYHGSFVQARTPEVSDCIIRQCTMKGNVGGINENFAIQTGLQSKNWYIGQVRCDYNNGSGISLNGDMKKEKIAPGTGLTSGHRVIGCRGSHNTWQGGTLYGAKDCYVADFEGSNNGKSKRWGAGFNVEWAYGTNVIRGLRAFNNFGSGLGGFGDITGLVLDDPKLSDNNMLDDPGLAEIAFKCGPWWDGSITGLLRDLTITGTASSYISPRTVGGKSRPHLSIRRSAIVNFPSDQIVIPRCFVRGIAGIASVADIRTTSATDRSGLSVNAH